MLIGCKYKMIKLLKAIGIFLGIIIGGLFLLIILLFIGFKLYWSFSERDYEEIISTKEFKVLESYIGTTKSFSNIAILPRDSIIVIDGTVINLMRKTYGTEPELGFYFSYYEESSKNKFTSFDSLLIQINSNLDVDNINLVLNEMKNLEIADIAIPNKDLSIIVFRWKVSAMHGEEGIIYAKDNELQHLENFDWIEITRVKDNYYIFYR